MNSFFLLIDTNLVLDATPFLLNSPQLIDLQFILKSNIIRKFVNTIRF
jgi:hypothetical protein